MSYTKILYDRVGDVAIVALNDPKTLNAVSPDLIEQLADAMLTAGKSARAVILTGTGRGFCSGANIVSGTDRTDPGFDAGAALESHYNPLMLLLRDLPIPFVTAVNGPAAGIGCALALMGDLIVASQGSYFLQAFVRIGLVPDGGTAYLLTRAIGRARAMEMMMLGEKIPAAKALDWGLINRVVPDDQVQQTALDLATLLARGPSQALGMIRRQGWQAAENDFETQLRQEREAQRDAGRTADHHEGLAAFSEKRPARFAGH